MNRDSARSNKMKLAYCRIGAPVMKSSSCQSRSSSRWPCVVEDQLAERARRRGSSPSCCGSRRSAAVPRSPSPSSGRGRRGPARRRRRRRGRSSRSARRPPRIARRRRRRRRERPARGRPRVPGVNSSRHEPSTRRRRSASGSPRYWRFFQSTSGWVPLLMPRAVRFLTSGVSCWRSSTTKSRIRSQPARAASGDRRLRAAGSSRHSDLQRGERARPPRAVPSGADQTVARYLGLSPASAAKSASDASGRPRACAVPEPPGGQEVVGVVDPLPLVEVDDPPDAVLVAVGVGDHRVRREGEPVRLQDEVVGDQPRRLQVLLHQGRRHRQRFGRVVEAGLVGGIDGELPRRPDVDARQVADRVVVLGVAQPPRQDRARDRRRSASPRACGSPRSSR